MSNPSLPPQPQSGQHRRLGLRIKARSSAAFDRPSTALLLLCATVITTLYAGSINAGEPGRLLHGWPFAATLLAILGTHELGHYLLARRNSVRSTLPLFIPGPPLVGTFGAVIRMRSAVRDRSVLLRIGAAGPLAGAVVAVPLLAVGLALSSIEPDAAGTQFMLGDSLLIKYLTDAILGTPPAGYTVYLHPVAFAGWIGLFVTNLNLFPAGQLDGGHVVYGVLGKHHAKISRLTFVGLALWGVFGDPAFVSVWHLLLGTLVCAAALALALQPAGKVAAARRLRRIYLIAAAAFVVAAMFGESFSSTNNWVVWSMIVAMVRLDHPSTVDLQRPPNLRNKLLAAACLVLFVLTFIPTPFEITG
ncbi:MAG: site-2 protease family protein [Candidatus Alcyoniella australis]|nr:site-2 protease family protein [Candidatus Alcyoniella australis]